VPHSRARLRIRFDAPNCHYALGAPSPSAAESVRGKVSDGLIYHTEGLQGFSHAWLIFVFHDNRSSKGAGRVHSQQTDIGSDSEMWGMPMQCT
jgi:hypothetical protein